MGRSIYYCLMYSKLAYSIAVYIGRKLSDEQPLAWPISLSIIMHHQQEQLHVTLEIERIEVDRKWVPYRSRMPCFSMRSG